MHWTTAKPVALKSCERKILKNVLAAEPISLVVALKI